MIPVSKPFIHVDENGDYHLSYDRLDCKRTSVRFFDLYRVLQTHTWRDYDNTVAFAPLTFPSYFSVYTGEYALCFSFAVALRLLQGTSPSVSATDEMDDLHLTVSCRSRHPDTLLAAFEKHDDIFVSLAQAAGFSVAFSAHENRFSVSFRLPFADTTDLELHAYDEDVAGDAFRAAFALPL